MAAILRISLLCAIVGAALAVAPAAALADCTGTPPPSPHVFIGVVLSVERDGRVAHVRTDDGQDVQVVGTPSESGITTADRTYKTGARYEFHPLNASSPFQDNACTRTRSIAIEQGGTSPYLLVFLGVALVGGVLVLYRWLRRAPIADS
ncbi:hypothetical protein [Nonomuraea sp. NPDC048901]|uniref:hypothetical protein n=1 Tax=Nonomuraea sp. NPDC048901 TaxID=3155627 RepID=UPI0033E895B0